MRILCAVMLATSACQGSNSEPIKKAEQAGSAAHDPWGGRDTQRAADDAAPPTQPASDDSAWLAAYENKGDEPIEKLSIKEGDGAFAAIVADRFLHAVAVEDAKLACDQRLPAERAKLAYQDGSCEETYGRIVKAQSTSTLNVFMVLHATAARRRGKVIAIDEDSDLRPDRSSHPEPFMTLLLVRDGDRWYLIDLPKSQDF